MPTPAAQALAVYLAAVNLIGFCVFGADKERARRGARRVPERTLFLLALSGGSIGTLLGMHVFHHKTRHGKFRVGLPLILLAHAALAIWLALR